MVVTEENPLFYLESVMFLTISLPMRPAGYQTPRPTGLARWSNARSRENFWILYRKGEGVRLHSSWVDWTCVATQEMRFVQLLKLCDFGLPFTINDLGCGYGALASFLDWWHGASGVDYLGIDLSREMVRRARQQWRGIDRVDSP